MTTIHKYPITIYDYIQLLMPKGAEVLCVQVQHEQPCIWAKVDTEQENEIRNFALRGTGHAFMGGEQKYIGSFQMQGGLLVFHLFESDR